MQQQASINFDYMKPSQNSTSIIRHDNEYIKRGKRSKSQRKIWLTVPYDDYEKEKMAECCKEIQKANIQLPPDWTPTDTLKMCYVSKFKSKNYVKNVKLHLEWRLNPLCHTLTEINTAFLQKGCIYTLGRGSQQRPIIIMNLELINLKQFALDTYINALSFFLDLIIKQCFVPGKVENWICIMDTKKLGVTQFPFKALSTAISTMQSNFCGCLEKLYIMNPSGSLDFSWRMISAMSDPESISKVSFLKPKDYPKIQEKIPANQLEQQFGGSVPNLTRFWPPINLEIPGGYPEDVLKAADSMKVPDLVIQKEVPVTEEEEAQLQKQFQQNKIPQQDEDDDDDA